MSEQVTNLNGATADYTKRRSLRNVAPENFKTGITTICFNYIMLRKMISKHRW